MKYKQLNEKFTLKSHVYEQVKREGTVAIFKQSHKENPDKFRYEVVRIGKHNGYTLGGTHLEPAETYPGASQWGINGFTCMTMEAAEKRFNKLKEDASDVDYETEKVERVEKVRKESTGQRKGKKRMEFEINIPVGKFSTKEFANACKVDVSMGANRLRELIQRGEVKFAEEKRVNPKGKPTKFYQKV